LLLDNSAQVAEDVVELVDAGLNLADLALALGDELLLELELVLRDLRGKRLRLRLHLLELDRVAFVADSTVTSSAPERVETGIAVGSAGMSRQSSPHWPNAIHAQHHCPFHSRRKCSPLLSQLDSALLHLDGSALLLGAQALHPLEPLEGLGKVAAELGLDSLAVTLGCQMSSNTCHCHCAFWSWRSCKRDR
jgi:hypothetical protein